MTMTEYEAVRMDKWLWAVRIFKTRKDAAEACRRNHVRLDQSFCKPSREVRPGQAVTVKREGIQWQYRVIKCIAKRVSAELAAQCKEDITPEDEREKLTRRNRGRVPRRPQGAGRPTKKERRTLQKFLGKE